MVEKMIQIFYIQDDACKSCQKVYNMVESAISKSGIECQILKFKYDTDAAIAIAVNNDIDDLPGFVVSGNSKTVFKGKNVAEEDIIKAIKKAGK